MGATTTPPKAARRARSNSVSGTPASEGATKGRRDWPYRFELAALERLFIDADYQRPLTSFVETVTAEYDPALVGTLIVSERADKRLAVIDGQTRCEAMRRNAEPAAPCLVYSNLTRAQEAELFADLQTKRRGMATFLRFRAALVAQKQEAVAIAGIVTKAGRNAGFELGIQDKGTTVKAIAALEKTYRKDPTLLVTIMNLIAAAWPAAGTATEPKKYEARVSSDMINGLAIFITRETKVDIERLRERLAGTEPRTIRHRANALQEGSGSGSGGRAGYMADAILGIYMRGRGRASVAA